MKMGVIDLDFLMQILPLLFQGLLLTIELTLLTIVFGTIIGLIIALMKVSQFKPFAVIGSFYTWVIRGVPLLVQLYVLYFGLPQLGIELEPFPAAVIGLSICGGAYIAEIIRGAIQSIDKGQMEAALSLGMSHTQAMRRIIIPQTYKRLLPPLGNEFITLTKDTSLVSIISMTELLRQGKLLSNSTFRSMEVFLTVAVLYLLLTTILVFVVSRLEKKLGLTEG